MAIIPEIIRFKNYIQFKANSIEDKTNELFFEFKNIPEYYSHTINKLDVKYDEKYGNNLVIICPGNNTYTLDYNGHYCQMFQAINEEDKNNINTNTPKKTFLYKYQNQNPNPNSSYGNYIIYVEEFKIDNLKNDEFKFKMVKLGIEVGLLIALYNNQTNPADQIKNIRLPGIGTTFDTPNERYYLNYYRDLFLHSLVATLESKGILETIESIQFCNQISNQYDIYGSNINSEDLDDFNNLLDTKKKYENCKKYYLYNGQKYLEQFNNISDINLSNTNNFFTLDRDVNQEASNIFIDVTMEKIYTEIISDYSKRSEWLQKYEIDKLYGDNNYNGTDTLVETDSGKINVCPYNSKNYGNMCWLNSANQFLLSINELGNFFIDNSTNYDSNIKNKIFFENMKNMLASYKKGYSGDLDKRKQSIISSIFNILNIDSFSTGEFTVNILGGQFEAVHYIERILGLSQSQVYNTDENYYKLIKTNLGSVEIIFSTMYYQKLNHKAVTYTGTYFKTIRTINKIAPIIDFTQFIENIKPHQNLVQSLNISMSDTINGAKLYDISNKNVIFPYLETKKYIIVKYIGHQTVRLRKCYHKVELINGKKYICKAILVNTGSHYICYKLNNADKNKYDIYDDTQQNISSYNTSNNIINIGHTIECVLYELNNDIADIEIKEDIFDEIKKEYLKLNFFIHLKEEDQSKNNYDNIIATDYDLHKNKKDDKKDDKPTDKLTLKLEELNKKKQTFESDITKSILLGKSEIEIIKKNKILLDEIKKTEDIIKYTKTVEHEMTKNKDHINKVKISKLLDDINTLSGTIPLGSHLVDYIASIVSPSTTPISIQTKPNKVTKQINNNQKLPALFAHTYEINDDRYVKQALVNYKPVDMLPIAVFDAIFSPKRKQQRFPLARIPLLPLF